MDFRQEVWHLPTSVPFFSFWLEEQCRVRLVKYDGFKAGGCSVLSLVTGGCRVNAVEQAVLDSLSGQGTTVGLGLHLLSSLVAPIRANYMVSPSVQVALCCVRLS